MPTGYSGTPLATKLGIKDPMRVAVLDAPAPYESIVGDLPHGVSVGDVASGAADLVHVFATRRSDLAMHLKRLRRTLGAEAAVWVSWPKKASKVPTDITEDTIRELALPLGFVDIKVCAVSEVWSGLKLVVRRALRRAQAWCLGAALAALGLAGCVSPIETAAGEEKTMRSTELESLVRVWFEAASSGSLVAIERHVAMDEETRLIGSDPKEWFVGGAAVTAFLQGEVLGAAGTVRFIPSDVEAFARGDVGWATAKLTVQMPDGRSVRPRWSAVFRRQEGTWKIVQLHASIAVRNEEIGWTYPEAATAER